MVWPPWSALFELTNRESHENNLNISIFEYVNLNTFPIFAGNLKSKTLVKKSMAFEKSMFILKSFVYIDYGALRSLFLFTVQPTFLSDPRKRSFLDLGALWIIFADFSVWEPIGHFMQIFQFGIPPVILCRFFSLGVHRSFCAVFQFGSPPVI